MTRVADTSFLLVLFDERDVRRSSARARAADPEPIEVPPEVLGETIGVAHRRLGFAAARKILEALRSLPHLKFLSVTDPPRVAAVFEEAAGRLSWVDAAVVAYCRMHAARPLAFDPDIERAVT